MPTKAVRAIDDEFVPPRRPPASQRRHSGADPSHTDAYRADENMNEIIRKRPQFGETATEKKAVADTPGFRPGRQKNQETAPSFRPKQEEIPATEFFEFPGFGSALDNDRSTPLNRPINRIPLPEVDRPTNRAPPSVHTAENVVVLPKNNDDKNDSKSQTLPANFPFTTHAQNNNSHRQPTQLLSTGTLKKFMTKKVASV